MTDKLMYRVVTDAEEIQRLRDGKKINSWLGDPINSMNKYDVVEFVLQRNDSYSHFVANREKIREMCDEGKTSLEDALLAYALQALPYNRYIYNRLNGFRE